MHAGTNQKYFAELAYPLPEEYAKDRRAWPNILYFDQFLTGVNMLLLLLIGLVLCTHKQSFGNQVHNNWQQKFDLVMNDAVESAWKILAAEKHVLLMIKMNSYLNVLSDKKLINTASYFVHFSLFNRLSDGISQTLMRYWHHQMVKMKGSGNMNICGKFVENLSEKG